MTLGVAAGLAASIALGRAMASLLFDVRPTDPVVMAAASAVVLLATVVTVGLLVNSGSPSGVRQH